MSRPGTASRRNTLRSSDQQPANASQTSSNVSARRQSTRNDHNVTASQASTPSSINPSVPEESNAPGQIAEQGLAPFDLSASFAYPSGGPLMWDWHSNMDFGDFATFYEPQGELAAPEMHPQPPMLSDFSTPFRVTSDIATSTTVATSVPTVSLSTPASSTPQQQPDPLPVDVTTEPVPKRTASKRKESESAPTASTAPAATNHPNTTSGPTPSAAKRARISSSNTQPASSRTTMTRSKTSSHQVPPPSVPRISQSPSETDSPRAGPPPQPPETSSTGASPEFSMKKPDQQPETIVVGQPRRIAGLPKFTAVLPAGKVFPIQIGSELFRLSGASISSDAPSYFSHYFSDQLMQTDGRASSIKTLYIDRDPCTFRDIALHLQGYYIKPRDSAHFVKLFADAQFYSLPRLTQQLFKSEIYVRVGNRDFEIPRDIFSSPGDSPNYFSLGFAHFFSTPSEVFPGLDRQTLLRPPSILPPAVPNRSGDVFADLLRLLQGYEVKIRDESHRAELLRDARYFHLRGIEQRLIPCSTSHNLLRNRQEILIKLEDIRQSGISFTPDPESPGVFKDSTGASKAATPLAAQEAAQNVPSGWISYQRPFVDEASCELVLELSSTEHMKVDVAVMRATFSGQTKARISSLFQVVANKLNLPATMPLGLMMMQSGGGMAAQPVSPANSGVSGEKVRVRIMRDAWVEVDGAVVEWGIGDDELQEERRASTSFSMERGCDTYLPPIKRWKDGEELYANAEWIVRKSQWRLRVESSEDDSSRVEVVMCAVRIMAHTDERFRNAQRGFLT